MSQLQSAAKIAEKIGFSETAVRCYINSAELKPSRETVREWRAMAQRGKTIFTPEQDRILLENYLLIPEKVLALRIGLSSTCLRIRRKQLGLIIPNNIIANRKNMTRFKAGQQSHNKGKKQVDYMSPEGLERAKAKQFKKGNIPHNQYPENVVTIRTDYKTGISYQWARLSPRKWEPLHRIVWQNANGPIPEGHLVIFKNGDTTNCNLSNLECISHAEHGSRCSRQMHARPQELKIAIKLNNQLISKIKNKTHAKTKTEHPERP